MPLPMASPIARETARAAEVQAPCALKVPTPENGPYDNRPAQLTGSSSCDYVKSLPIISVIPHVTPVNTI
jgi:hypothetical protein